MRIAIMRNTIGSQEVDCTIAKSDTRSRSRAHYFRAVTGFPLDNITTQNQIHRCFAIVSIDAIIPRPAVSIILQSL
jgi:hypothetical protein